MSRSSGLESRMKTAFSRLEKVMSGQTSLRACPFDVYAWFVSITTYDSEDTFSSLSTGERAIILQTWNLAFRWIVTARSEKDIMEFCELECHCPPAKRSLDHTRAEGNRNSMAQSNAFSHLKPISPAWMLIVAFTVKLNALADGNDPESHLFTLRRIRKRVYWPNSVQDLLPLGAERTLQGVLQWFAASPHQPLTRQLYAVYSALIQICHPLVIPHIVNDPRFVTHAIIGPVHSLLAMITAQPIPSMDTMFQRFQEAIKFMDLLCQLLRCTGWGRFSPAELTALNGHDPQTLFNTYAGLIRVCDGLIEQILHFNLDTQKLPALRNDIATPAMALVKEYKTRLSFKGDDEVQQKLLHDTLNRKHNQEPGWTSWQSFIQILMWLDPTINQTCLAPLCNRTLADSRLKQCLGCERVHYCSRSCQKQAWRHRVVPHRLMCHLVAKICKGHAIPPAISPHALEKMKPSRGSEEPSQAVVNHFVTLSAPKLRFPTKAGDRVAG